MRDKIKQFTTDYYKIGMVILDLLLLASMPFKPELEWNHFTYFSLITRIAFPLIVIIFGNKGIWIFYYITAIVKTLDITFDDFTAISALCILTLFVDEDYKWLKCTTIITYVVAIFLVATLHDKEPYHLFVHFIGCLILYLTVYKLRHKEEVRKLDLTLDEEYIIQKLIEGYQQKEIDRFSPNTVSDKLKQARKRNGLEHTDELIRLYKG